MKESCKNCFYWHQLYSSEYGICSKGVTSFMNSALGHKFLSHYPETKEDFSCPHFNKTTEERRILKPETIK